MVLEGIVEAAEMRPLLRLLVVLLIGISMWFATLVIFDGTLQIVLAYAMYISVKLFRRFRPNWFNGAASRVASARERRQVQLEAARGTSVRLSGPVIGIVMFVLLMLLGYYLNA